MEQQEINILEYWDVLKRGFRTIVLITFVATSLSIGISLVLPKTYRAEAMLMPLGGTKMGVSAAVAQMGLGGLLGGLTGGSSNSIQIMAILKSRTLAEKIIEKDNLLPVLFSKKWDAEEKKWKGDAPTMEEAVNKLRQDVSFVEDKKDQTILLSAEFRDPNLTADVVNDFIKELALHINQNTFTMAKKNRIFIEGQLERNKMELLSAGKELTSFYSANKVSNAVPTVDVDVAVKKAVDSSADNAGQGDDRLDELQRQLEDVNRQLTDTVVKQVPQQVYLQYLTLRQDLLGKVNVLLTQQYEMAKIEESKEDLTFQVIDWAEVPIKRFKPQRSRIVVTAFVMSGLIAVFFVFFREYIAKLKGSGSRA